MMNIEWIVLTAESGLPLCARRACTNLSPSCSSAEIPLTTVSTLYGLNLFSRLNGCELLQASSTTGEQRVHWRTFHNITMIMISNNVSFLTDHLMGQLMNLITESLVMMCGLQCLDTDDVETLRYGLKVAYSLVDYLLKTFLSTSTNRIGLLMESVPYCFTPRSSFIESTVNSAVKHHNSISHCALFANRQLLSTDRHWWNNLTKRQTLLLTCLVNSLSLVQTKEFIVNLRESTNRVVVAPIMPGIVLCLLCDLHHPNLEYLESEIIVPLNDPKLQEDKLLRFVQEEHSLIEAVFELELPSLCDLTGFIFFNHEHSVYFVYNDRYINNFMDDIILFCGMDQKLDDEGEACYFENDFKLYRLKIDSLELCLLYHSPSPMSAKLMKQNAQTLITAFQKTNYLLSC